MIVRSFCKFVIVLIVQVLAIFVRLLMLLLVMVFRDLSCIRVINLVFVLELVVLCCIYHFLLDLLY